MLSKPDYGIDAPGVIRNLLVAGFLCLAIACFKDIFRVGSVVIEARPLFVWSGVFVTLAGLQMLLYAKIGKFRHREAMLSLVDWNRATSALDIGTGRGLLLIGAAKRLPVGARAVGIDIWNESDLTGNSLQKTLANLEAENVAGRADILSEDARSMSFPDATFDVVLSNLCLHNISETDGRAKACREIARVLKPGGTAILSDFRNNGQYADTLRESGLKVRKYLPNVLITYPPLTIIEARKL